MLKDFLKLDSKIFIREVDFRGQVLRIRVPLAPEMEESYNRTQAPSEDIIRELTQKLEEENQKESEKTSPESDEFKAASKTRAYIIEAFGLLCNENGENYPREQLTITSIDADFPLAIQLEIARLVFQTLSVNWVDTKKN